MWQICRRITACFMLWSESGVGTDLLLSSVAKNTFRLALYRWRSRPGKWRSVENRSGPGSEAETGTCMRMGVGEIQADVSPLGRSRELALVLVYRDHPPGGAPHSSFNAGGSHRPPLPSCGSCSSGTWKRRFHPPPGQTCSSLFSCWFCSHTHKLPPCSPPGLSSVRGPFWKNRST